MSDNYTFNWHDLPNFRDNGEAYEAFLKWAMIHLTVDESATDRTDPTLFALLQDATDNFTKVTLTVQLSGVEVNPQHLLRAIHGNMADVARQHAVDLLEQRAEFVQLRATVDLLEQAIVSRITHVADDLGIDLDAERLRAGGEL